MGLRDVMRSSSTVRRLFARSDGWGCLTPVCVPILGGGLPSPVGTKLLKRGLPRSTSKADQRASGGVPALDPKRAICLLADPDLVTSMQAEPAT
jgi:hypothetical protein